MDYLQNTLYKDDIAAACRNIPAFERLYETRILITGATGLVGSFLVDIRIYTEIDFIYSSINIKIQFS